MDFFLKLEYGYIYLEYTDSNSTLKSKKYPFDCKLFDKYNYMYVNPVLSDYIWRHDNEFYDSELVKLDFN